MTVASRTKLSRPSNCADDRPVSAMVRVSGGKLDRGQNEDLNGDLHLHETGHRNSLHNILYLQYDDVYKFNTHT